MTSKGMLYAMAAASLLMGGLGGAPIAGPRRKRSWPSHRSPNDDGPVIDTTKESKRARRRRLAKAKHITG